MANPGKMRPLGNADELTQCVRDGVSEILWINRQVVKQNQEILYHLLNPVYVLDPEIPTTERGGDV